MGKTRRHAFAKPAGRYHVWCSPHNPTALELLEELKQFGGWKDTLEGPTYAAEAGGTNCL